MNAIFLGIYIALILIRPMDWWEPMLNWQVVTIGAVVTAFVGLPAILGRFSLTWKQVPQLKLAITFLMATCLSWLAQFYLTGAIDTFQEVGKVIFFFALILIMVHTMRDAKILLWSFLFCAAWLAIHAIMQHYTGHGFGGKEPLYRIRDYETRETTRQAVAFGTFEDPNDLCVVLVVAIPLFYTQFKTSANSILKVLSLAGVTLCGYGAWATNSRGGVVAIFGMITSYILTQAKGFKRYLILAVAISSVTILAPSRFGGGTFSGKDRSTLWGDGLDMFKAHPLFGVGYGEFTTFSSDHLVAHNTFVHTLAELGLVGYLPLFLLFFCTVIQLRRILNLKKLISRDDHVLLTGIYASLIGYMTGLYFISRQYQHILYVILSLAITPVHIICTQYNLYETVFQTKKDLKNGLFWGLGSVVFIWLTVRLVNMMG